MFSEKTRRIILITGLAAAAAGLLLFAYLGTFNRFFADDWCYNQDFKKLGLFGTLGGYVFQTRYASNRFSLTLFSGLMYPLWVPGVRLMTAAAAGAWVWALYSFFTDLDDRLKLVGKRAVRLLFASLLVYYILYLAPHPYQNLHWRAGFMPYTAPMLFGSFLAALYARQARDSVPSKKKTVLAFALAFFAGGFSEAANTLIVAGLALLLAAVFLANREGKEWAAVLLPGAAAGLIGGVLSTILLVASPAIPARMISYSAPTPFAELPGLVIYLGLIFMELFVKGLPLPTLVIFLAGGALGVVFIRKEKVLDVRRYAGLLLGVLGVAFVLIAASQAPSAYVEHGPPEARGLYPARVVMIFALAASAGLTGVLLRSRIKKEAVNLAVTASLLVCFAYTVRSILITTERLPIYADRAATWDDRHAQILADKANGLTEIAVHGIDSKPVNGMKDLKPNPKDWVNVCAAEYYDVDRLAATLP